MRKKLYVYNNKKRVFNKLYIYILEKITRIYNRCNIIQISISILQVVFLR